MRIESADSDKFTWLANQIFSAFPKEVTGLKFYVLDCGCIYYQRVYKDGNINAQIGIYREAEDGPCQICLLQDTTWKERSFDEIIVYNSKFQIEVKEQ